MTGLLLDIVAFLSLVNLGVSPVVATTISTSAGILNNYLWNSILNFGLRLSGYRGAKYLTVGLVGLFASALLLSALLGAGLAVEYAKLLSIPPVVLGQFLMNRAWTFRRPLG